MTDVVIGLGRGWAKTAATRPDEHGRPYLHDGVVHGLGTLRGWAAGEVKSPARVKLGMGVRCSGRNLLRPGMAAYTEHGVLTTRREEFPTETRSFS